MKQLKRAVSLVLVMTMIVAMFSMNFTIASAADDAAPLLGDADRNGSINVFDASFVQKGLTGTNGYPDYSTMDRDSIDYKIADVDGNGVVNIFDAALIQKWIAGDANAQKYPIGQPIEIVVPTEPTEAPATEAPVTEAPATEAPATEAPATEAPVIDYYLVGSFNDWAISDDYKLDAHTADDEAEEYKIVVDLKADDELKIMSSDGKWYPDLADNYKITEDGTYSIYFRPNGDGHDDWYKDVLFAAKHVEPTEAPATEAPATEAPATEAPATEAPATEAPATEAPVIDYYLVGSFNDWTISDEYKLAAHESDDEAEEYKIVVELKADDELKIKSSDGKWFPDDAGNYKVAKDGTYSIYFRPNKDGHDDWYKGVLYAAKHAEPTEAPATEAPATEAPATEAPATEASATEAPATEAPATEAPVIDYYLVGSFTEWAVDDTLKLAAHESADGAEEYKIVVELKAGDEFKVKSSADKWFPEGFGENYKVTEDGTYNVYFRPNYDGHDDWYKKVIYASLQAPATVDEPTEAPATEAPATEAPATEAPATEAPATEAPATVYYLVGNFNSWTVADEYALTAIEAGDGAEEYKIVVDFNKGDEFKVKSSDGKWFPDNADNYKVTEAGTYNVYFRPNKDGHDDWYKKVIYASLQTPATVDEPTEAPATEAPATEAPATEAPATEAPATEAPVIDYYLVGSFTEWAVDEAYKLAAHESADGAEEYKIVVDLKAGDEFKVKSSADKWFPEGFGENYKVTEDGTYNVYFRPNYDGHDDWYKKVIYASLQAPATVDEPTEAPATEAPATEAPATEAPATEAPATEAPATVYYLVGNFNSWTAADEYALTAIESADGAEEYKIVVELKAGDEFKVKSSADKWFPEGFGENYKVTEDGTYNVYFRPNYDGHDDWFKSVIYAALQAPATVDEPTEAPATEAPATEAPATEAPATEAPATEAPATVYYLVGNFNSWTVADEYALTAIEAGDGAEEYKIVVDFNKGDEFKVKSSDGKWFPDNADNYKVTEAGTYNVYFRPNKDGHDDWYKKVIYASLQTPATVDEPTEAPATEAPATEAPATEAPATEAPATEAPATEAPVIDYYLVGSFTEWAVDEAYKLAAHESADGAEEYKIVVELKAGDEFKVKSSADKWFPEGFGENYKVTEDGTYNVYFRPNYDGHDDWFKSVIYAALQTPATVDEPTEAPATEAPATEAPATEAPATEAPATEAPATVYYLVGNFNSWTVADEYALTAIEAGDGAEEYKIVVDFNKGDEFKVKSSDGKWFPDNADNYKVTEAGTYNVYFRPNKDGHDDWYKKVIYASLQTPATVDEPTEAPATEAPATEAPATEAPATEAPATEAPATEAPVIDYYLVGSFTEWAVDEAYKLAAHESADGAEEYKIVVELKAGDEFKVKSSADKWFPEGFGENYKVTEDGTYNVYFRPNYDGHGDWFKSVIYAALQTPATVDEPTEAPATEAPATEAPATEAPATEAPATEAPATVYYLVGNFNSWTVADEYALTAIESADGAEEYKIVVDFKAGDEFKVKSSDGKWFPDNADNYKVKEDGTYNVYFRPNKDGHDDWYKKVIYASLQTPATVDEPTEAPATEAPATEAPATEAPATEAPATEAPVIDYYLVGSFTEWAVDEAYKLAAHESADGAEEYKIVVELKAGDEFKVKSSADKWFPEGFGENYKVTEDGTYNVYFRPNYDGHGDWFKSVIYAALQAPATVDEPTEAPATEAPATEAPATEAPATEAPATEAPATEAPATVYYLVGNFNSWTVADEYALTAIEAGDGAEEYKIVVDFKAGGEFKIKSSDGKWFPDNADNYKVTEAGTYNVYFRPNKDGHDDWYKKVIYASLQTPATVDEPTEAPATEAPATEAPATEAPATEAPVIDYYLVGSFTEWAVDEAYKLAAHESADGAEEYKIVVELKAGDEFKVKSSADKWFPEGFGENYKVTEDGTYNVYFRPNYDGHGDWFKSVIYAALQAPATVDEPTEAPATEAPATEAPATEAPATEAPATEAPATVYYLVGNFNSWTVADEYALTAIEAGDGAEEYKIVVDFNKGDEFKVKSSDGKWFPDNADNYKVTEAGTYNVYFRPNKDGHDDWYKKVIYASLQTPATVDEPTEAPATEAPATEAPATEAPATEAPATEAPATEAPVIDYYLVGSFTEWAVDEAYKLAAHESADGAEEYKIVVDLKAGDEFKVKSSADKWFPEGFGENYKVTEDGTYNVYFRPNYDGHDDWYKKVIYASLQAPATVDEPTEAPATEAPATEAPATEAPATEAPATEAPATEAPATEAPATVYYLVGNFNSWTVADEYALTAIESADGAEEYKIVVDFKAGDEFKVKSSDGKWFPDNADNYKVKEDGTYNVYFRPNKDGHDDWYKKVIYASLQAPATVDEPTEAPATEVPATEAPATEAPATEAPATEAPATVYYLVGSFNQWTAADEYALAAHESADGAEEYKIVIDLQAGDQLKVKSSTDKWYPDNMGNYEIKEDGTYAIYFRPNKDGHDDWYAKYIYAALQAPATVDEPTEAPATEAPATEAPATEAPATEAPATVYYLVGNFNSWTVADEYALTAIESADGAEEYKIVVDFKAGDEFKVKSSDGKWFPDNADNYKVTEAGTYNVYFRPNKDGHDDWYKKVIYASLQAPATVDEPTEAPATEAPATEAPATEAPATEAPATEAPATEAPATVYYLVGSFNQWTAADEYAFAAHESADGAEEYKIVIDLQAGDQLKVTSSEGKWYPDNMGNYEIKEDGTYAIYFRPNKDGHDDWYAKYIYAALQAPATVDEPTEAPATEAPATEAPATEAPATEAPATEAPATEAPATVYYLVGSFNQWTAADEYALAAHESADGAEEYKIVIDLQAGDQLKVKSSTNKWYPDNMGNYEIKEDGTYAIYFRPNKDGHDDWYAKYIYAALQAPATVDEPTEAPATEAPATEAPATEAPATEAPTEEPTAIHEYVVTLTVDEEFCAFDYHVYYDDSVYDFVSAEYPAWSKDVDGDYENNVVVRDFTDEDEPVSGVCYVNGTCKKDTYDLTAGGVLIDLKLCGPADATAVPVTAIVKIADEEIASNENDTQTNLGFAWKAEFDGETVSEGSIEDGLTFNENEVTGKGSFLIQKVEVPTSRSMRVSVISYLLNDLGTDGWYIHYWGGESGSGDVSLTRGISVSYKIIEGCWNYTTQNFYDFSADIPYDATGFKVYYQPSNRWFGGDGNTETHSKAYIYEYDGVDRALYN